MLKINLTMTQGQLWIQYSYAFNLSHMFSIAVSIHRIANKKCELIM